MSFVSDTISLNVTNSLFVCFFWLQSKWVSLVIICLALFTLWNYFFIQCSKWDCLQRLQKVYSSLNFINIKYCKKEKSEIPKFIIKFAITAQIFAFRCCSLKLQLQSGCVRLISSKLLNLRSKCAFDLIFYILFHTIDAIKASFHFYQYITLRKLIYIS